MAKQLNVNMSIQADTTQAKKALSDLNKTLDNILSHRTITVEDQSIQQAKQAALDLKHHLDAAVNVNTGKLDLSKFSASLNKSGQNLQGLYTNLSKIGPEGQSAFLSLSQSIAKADASAISLGSKLSGFMTTLKNTAKWQISSSILHGFMGAIQSAYGYAQDLNESLNNIRIVTGQSEDQMARFAREANNAAKALSTTTTEYTNASLIYYQQGLSDEEVKARTDATIKLANVSRQSAEEVSDQMTAVWNNFAEGSNNLEYYIDVMAKLGATTASSTQEISTGLEKFAAVASTVGLSYEYATAALATVTAKTRQSADVVGTAFKTLFARLQDLELGDALEDGTTLGNYSAALNAVGVNIKDINGEVKDMDVILDELGSKWNKISKDQQIALAQTVAGTRQYTQLIALMDNWDFMQENLNTVAGASGELDRQAKIYAESWEAARDRVRAAAEDIYSQLLNDNAFIDILNGFEKVLDFISNIIDGLGGLKGVLLLIGSIFMQQYAKEMPAFLEKMTTGIAILTGKEDERRKKMLADNAKIINEMNPNTGSAGTDAQIIGMQKVSNMYSELAIKQSTLSKAEIEAAKSQIQEMELHTQLAQKIGEEVDQIERKNQELERGIRLDLSRNKNFGTINMDNFSDEQSQAIIEGVGTLYEEQYNKLQRLRSEYGKLSELDKNSLLGDAFRENIEKAEVEFDKLVKKTTGADLFKAFVSAGEQTGLLTKNLVDIEERTSSWATKLKGLDSGSKEFKEITTEIDAYVQKAKEAGANTDAVQNALKKLDGSEESIQKLVDALVELSTSGADDLVVNFDKIKTALVNLGADSTELDKLEEGLRDGSIKAEEFKTKIEEIKQKMAGGFQHTAQASEGFTQLASTLMQVSMAINAIKNLGNIWNDDDLSTGEKILQTMMSLGTILPLISSMTKLQTTLNGLFAKSQVAVGASGEAAAAGEVAAATGAKTLKLALWEVYLIVAAVVAVVWLLVKAFDAIKASSLEGQLENAKKGAEDAAKAAEEAKNAYADLKSEIENYDNAVSKIKELTKGTDEFKEAVEEANDAARELIKLYKLTSFSIDENGIIQLDPDELESRKVEYREKVHRTEANSLGADNYQREKEDNISKHEMSVIAKNYSTINTNSLLTGENIQKAQTALGVTDFTGQTFESIAKAMGWEGELNAAQKDFVNSLLKAGDALQEYGDSLKQSAQATSAATKSFLASALTDNEEFLKSNNQNAILETQMRKEKDIDKVLDKEISKLSMSELYDKYANAMGYSSHGTGTWLDGKETFYDENGQEVADLTDQQIKEYYKAIRKAEEMETGATEAIESVNRIIASAGKNSNLVASTLAGEDITNSFTYNQSNKNKEELLNSLRITDEEAQAIGYENAEAYMSALEKNLNNSQNLWEKIDRDKIKLPDNILDNISLDLAQKLQDKINKIGAGPLGEKAGELFGDGLNKMLSSLDEDKQQKALEQLINVDWSNWDAGKEAEKIIRDLGGDLDSIDWEKFINDMRTANFAFPDFASLRDSIVEVSEVLNDLSFGKIIKDDDYNKLIAYENAWKDLFITQADGTHKFIGNEQQMKQATIDSLDEQKKMLDERAAAVEKLKSKSWYYGGNAKDTVDWGNVKKESQNAQGLINLWNSESGNDLLKNLGYTQERIDSFATAAPEEIEAAYKAIADAMNASYDVENEQWNEMRASFANNYAELLDMANKISKEAFSKRASEMATEISKNATSLEQLQTGLGQLGGIFDFGENNNLFYDEYAQGLQKIASQYESCSEAATSYQDALNALKNATNENRASLEEAVKKTEDHLEAMIQAEEAASKYDLKIKVLNAQTKEITQTEGVSEKQALAIAVANERMNRGVSSLVNNWQKWKKTLTTTDNTAEDFAETLADVSEAVTDLVGWYDDLALDSKFVEKNMELIDKAAQGDVTAILELGAAVAQLEIQEASLNTTLAKGLMADGGTNAFQEWADSALSAQVNFERLQTSLGGMFGIIQDNMTALQNGASLQDVLGGPGGLEAFVEQLNAYAAATGMTAEQMQSMLSSVGVTANVQSDYQEQNVTVPTYTEVTWPESTKSFTYTTFDGQQVTEQIPQIKHATIPGPPITTTGYVEVASISMDGNGEAPGVSPPKFIGKKAPSSTAKSGGGGGGKSGGGGSKAKEPTKKETKNPTDEKDRYHVIKEQLDDLSQAYDRVNKAKDRAFGANKLAGIKAEQKILKEQIDAQDEYLRQIKEMGKYDVNNLQHGKEKGFAMDGEWYATGGLSYYGLEAQLDENGVLTNYDQIVEAAVAKYNEAVAYYNGLTGEQQENDKSLEFAEKQYSSFMDLLKQYEETNNLFQDETDKRQELINQWQDNNYEALSYEIELKLKINEDELKWLEYQLKKIGDDVYKTSEAIANLFSLEGSSQASVAVQAMDDLLTHMNKLDEAYAKGEISEADYFAALEETKDGMYEQLEAMMAIDEQMEEYYANTLSKITEELDKFTDSMRHNIDVVNHMKDILELSGRGQDYEAIGSLLNANMSQTGDIYEASKERYDMLVHQEEEAQARLEEALRTGGKEEQEIAQKNLDAIIAARQEAENTMYEDWKAHLEACNAVLENELNRTKKVWDDIYTDGQGWEYLEQVMDLAQCIGDKYLTKTNQLYETNKMLRTIQQDMDKTTNKAAQQRLNNFAKEIQNLQQIGELSKDNLEIAKAQYEVLKAEIALEEAQNAKSTVRLQRDNEGNYGYVYTADQDKVEDARQQLEDRRNDLYNLALEQENKNAQDILQINKEKNEALDALNRQYYIDKTITEEEYNQRSQEIQQKYNDLLLAATKDHLIARTILNQESITGENDSWTAEYADLVNKGYAYIDDQNEFWNLGFGAITNNRQQWFSTEGPEWDAFYNNIMNGANQTQIAWNNELATMQNNTKPAIEAFNAAVGVDEQSGVRGTLLNLQTKLKDVTTATSDYKEQLVGDDGLIKNLGEEASKVQESTTQWGKYYDKLKGQGGVISAVEEAIIKIKELIKVASTNASATYTTTYVRVGSPEPDMKDQSATYTTNYVSNGSPSGGGGSGGGSISSGNGQKTWQKNVYKQKNSSYHDVYNHYTDGSETFAYTEPHSFNGKECIKCKYKKSGGSGCFEGDTKIILEDYSEKMIKDIKIGDKVLAYNEEKHYFEAQPVLDIFIKRNNNHTVNVNLSNGITLKMTAGHPILTTSGWKSRDLEESLLEHGMNVNYLNIGDIVLGFGISGRVESITDNYYEKNNNIVYTLKVDICHTFIANNIIVHNSKVAAPFASGGYTGEWIGGSQLDNGKLAILHQKELVLNEDDTKNMLQTVSLVRELSNTIGLRAAASGVATGLSSAFAFDNAQTLEQSVTIHAEFPNAVNHNEIEEAFNTLINRASQFAGRSTF